MVYFTIWREDEKGGVLQGQKEKDVGVDPDTCVRAVQGKTSAQRISNTRK